MIQAISHLLDDPIHADLGAADLKALREIRLQMQTAEADISLVRRLTQGRMDIVGHEVAERAERSDADAVDTSAVLFELPDILADSPGASRSGRLSINEPGPVAHELISELDALISANALANISESSESDLNGFMQGLNGFEEKLSGGRKGLHERIDSIQREIGTRYASGAATTEDAFKS